MHTIVERFGGHINKYIGDGLMIVFGAPVDRGDKDEARAAVRCGLAMLEEVEKMNEDWKGTGREATFLRAVHARACRYFRVAIGPDFNEAHWNHFHYDRGIMRTCK